MDLKNSVSVAVLLAIGATTAQAQELNAEYKEAVSTLQQEGIEAGLPKLESLVANRWNEMSPMGKHGALTMVMFCELGLARVDDAREHGAWLYRELPEAFSSLADFSASDVPGRELAELRASIHLLSLMTAKGSALVYMHNASDRPIEITGTRYDVSYGYETATSSVGNLSSSGKVAFQNALELPPGGGAFLRSSTGEGLLSTALPDCVAIIAAATAARLPGWFHLSKGDYTQTLRKVHITADVKWGDAELKRVALARYDEPIDAAGNGGPPTGNGGPPTEHGATEQD